MKNNASITYALLLIVGDFLALITAFTIAYIIRVKLDPRHLVEQIPALTYLSTVLIVMPFWILVNAFIGLYSHSVYEKRFTELGRLFVGSVIGILVVIGYNFVTNGHLFPARLVPVYGLILGFSFLVLFRALARKIRESLYAVGTGISNVLIVGDTPITLEVANSICNTHKTGQRILGIVGHQVGSFKAYSTFSEAISSIKRPIHSIIQTDVYRDQSKNNEILTYAQEHHVSYRFVPSNSDLFVGKIAVELFAGLPMVAVHQTALIGWGRIVKRIFDVIFTLLAMVIALPIMLFVVILLGLFDREGGILFRQTRLTRFNRKFQVLKFRTLKPTYNGLSPEDAFSKMGKPELAKKYRESGDFIPNDPRFSPIGRFLRRTSLDELPQLFNVLKGDLSLVGPRALVPEELAEYTKRHTILSVKSGLTGLAVISGRRDIQFDERRQLDVYYVQNWSFWLDIVIVLKTLKAVFVGVGAK